MKEYTYSVARVRAKEESLLSKQDIEQMIFSESFSDALRVLRDKGYSLAEAEESGSITDGAERELWELLGELADENLVRLLRMPVDYHNMKASVKSVYSDTDAEELLRGGGTVDGALIYECVKKREYEELPAPLSADAEAAMSLLLRTQDGQLCDIYLDNALLAGIEKAAAQTGDDFIRRYAEMNTDITNLKTALRCAVMKKNEEFIAHAVAEGGSLNHDGLVRAAVNGTDSLCSYVEGTAYSGGAEAMKTSGAAFEKWCDDRIMQLMEEARYESFTAAPVLAYAYAKQAELKAVRMILSAKKNMLDNDRIRERVRRLYV